MVSPKGTCWADLWAAHLVAEKEHCWVAPKGRLQVVLTEYHLVAQMAEKMVLLKVGCWDETKAALWAEHSVAHWAARMVALLAEHWAGR